jgi:hypothetical protein
MTKTLSAAALTAALFLLSFSSCSTDSGSGSSVQFTRETKVYGIRILATSGVSEEKIRHAASVMAEYLDGDEDGTVDNPGVLAKMVENRATLVMFATEDESQDFNPKGLGGEYLQDLYATETHPGGAARGEFDASLEEVLHLITHAGYAQVYPEIFGEYRGSGISKAMDKARGGYFQTVPPSYPEGAWFTYYDETADYPTMITEYSYWLLTSILGGQEFPGRLDAIKEEWALNTRARVEAGDPDGYALMTDPKNLLPGVLPDGSYAPQDWEIKAVSLP